jgi:hypothetical protein
LILNDLNLINEKRKDMKEKGFPRVPGSSPDQTAQFSHPVTYIKHESKNPREKTQFKV